MRRSRLQTRLLPVVIGVSVMGTMTVLLRAATPNPPGLPDSTRQSPPPLPTTPAASAVFRGLLAMTPAELDQSLAARTPEQAGFIRAKIAEYRSLTPAEREKRLHLLDLRGQLLPLMHAPAASRAILLQQVPELDRAAVEDRLREWDKVPTEDQKEFLAHEGNMQYMLRLESSTPEQRNVLLQDFTVERRARLEKELEQWRAIPEENRRRMAGRFHQFFELDDTERKKTLNALSEAERQQIEATLQAFQNLQPEQRRICIEAFGKFASLSAEERNQFLRNARQWEAMSPVDRAAWRKLVQRAPPMPPLPPGFRQMPPLPPGLLLATNRSESSPQPPGF